MFQEEERLSYCRMKAALLEQGRSIPADPMLSSRRTVHTSPAISPCDVLRIMRLSKIQRIKVECSRVLHNLSCI